MEISMKYLFEYRISVTYYPEMGIAKRVWEKFQWSEIKCTCGHRVFLVAKSKQGASNL